MESTQKFKNYKEDRSKHWNLDYRGILKDQSHVSTVLILTEEWLNRDKPNKHISNKLKQVKPFLF